MKSILVFLGLVACIYATTVTISEYTTSGCTGTAASTGTITADGTCQKVGSGSSAVYVEGTTAHGNFTFTAYADSACATKEGGAVTLQNGVCYSLGESTYLEATWSAASLAIPSMIVCIMAALAALRF